MTKPCFILFFFWCCFLNAYGSGITIEALGENVQKGKSGEVVNLMFRVSNHSDEAKDLSLKWRVPEEWRAISNARSFQLKPGQSSLQLFSVHVPRNTLAGQYPLFFSIENSTLGTELANMEKMVEIIAFQSIELISGSAPEFVLAGEDIFVDFILHNQGNVIQDIVLSPDECKLKEGNRVTLYPGEKMIIHAKSTTIPTVRHNGRKILRLHAHLADSPEVIDYASHFIQVLPQAGLELVRGEDMPGSIRLTHLTRRFQNGEVVSGLQGEFHAIGTTDEVKQNEIEVKLRGPDRFNLSVLGQYDEYFARFKNKKNYAHLGDKVFTLTPLTEFSRFGRGAEISSKFGSFEAGGFYLQPRFFQEIESESAGYFRYHNPKGQQLGVHLLQKSFSEERGNASLFSLHGKANLGKNTHVEAEISQGSFEDTWGNAFFLRASSRPYERLNLSTNIIHAGKHYPGYFNNSTSFYFQAGYQAGRRWHLAAHYNEDQQNPSQDTLFGLAPWSRFAQFSTGYKINKTTSLRSIVRHSETKDRMSEKQFDFKEDLVRLQLIKKWGSLRLSLTGEFGERENLLNQTGPQSSYTYRAFADGNYQVSDRFSITGFSQYFYYEQFVGTPQKQWIVGGSLRAKPVPFS